MSESQLARDVVTSLSRRRLWRSLAGLLASAGIVHANNDVAIAKRKKKKKKKSNSPAAGCPGGCGFNERCVGNLCVPGCGTLTTPCGVNCCLAGVETCQNDQCVLLCADRRPPCNGVCCGAGQSCLGDACGVSCPVGRATCGTACCDAGETCQSGSCQPGCTGNDCAHYVYDRQWDGDGTEQGKFRGPNAIAVDADDNVYVIDPSSSRVLKFDSDGRHITSWTAAGYGIAVHADIVYVANGLFLSKFTTAGTFIAHLTANGMSGAQDVAVDEEGYVYVITSASAGRLFVFNPAGEAIRNWGGANGDFLFADGVAVDSVTGEVYVADTFHNRIQRFSSDGAFDNEWGPTGSEQRRLNAPNGLAIGPEGHIFVASYGADAIKVFEYDTGLRSTFNEGGTTGPLDGPAGVALDSDLNVYVADYLNKRVVKYRWTGRPLGGGGRPAVERRQTKRRND